MCDLESRRGDEPEATYRDQLTQYGEFIRGLISTNKILSRHFYVIIPFDGNGKMDFEASAEQLGAGERVDIVAKGLARLGISSEGLVELGVA